jgi:hypothetical protein
MLLEIAQIQSTNKKVGSRPLEHATSLETIYYKFVTYQTQGRGSPASRVLVKIFPC